MAKTRKPTKQQLLFATEYVVDLNGTQAAIRAGYSEKTAQEQASRLLSNVMVQEAISKEQNKRLERTEVNADYVLRRLIEIDEMDVCDIFEDDLTSLKPLNQWPKAWRITISGLDIQTLMIGDVETVLRKIKWPDKVKNLELLGKHIDIQAFKEQKELSGSLVVTHEEMLDQLK